jgi:XTP/dITP diphosphohydrolase
MPLRLVLATANPDKAREISELLAGLEASGMVELVPRPAEVPDVEESGATLEANARLKAQALVDATGEAAIADDTGLEVAALEGAPGVRTSRFAGPDATYTENVAELLAVLDGIGDRQARFRTVALARFPDGAELMAEGIASGTIASAPRGSGGFGYDPVFVPDDGDGLSFAELPPERKNASSHRARAFRAMAVLLRERARDEVPRAADLS